MKETDYWNEIDQTSEIVIKQLYKMLNGEENPHFEGQVVYIASQLLAKAFGTFKAIQNKKAYKAFEEHVFDHIRNDTKIHEKNVQSLLKKYPNPSS